MTQPLQAMVVLASEQVWPNIHGLVHWQEREGGLSDLCIYYTGDEHRSAGPARRLQEFCQEVYPEIRVHRPPSPLGIMPQDVRNQVRLWQAQLPGRRWIVNATGGLKPMFAGAISCCELPNTEVVYRELGGDWQRWVSSPDGPRPIPFFVDPAEMDSIPIQSLVKVQYPSSPEDRWSLSPVRRLPILQLVQKGLETQWNWNQMFRSCGLDAAKQPGFLFEDFVGACLWELGIREVCKNIVLKGGEGQTLQEIDVAANHHGKLLIIDCKLRTKEEEGIRVVGLTSQIRQAYTICRELGGVGARLLLLRPGWIFSGEEIQLAEALQLQVLDAPQTMDFFRKLAEFCGFRGPLPPQLQAAQEELDRARAQGVCQAFSATSLNQSGRSRGVEVPLETILPLGSYLEELSRRLHQDWMAFQIDQFLWIRGKNVHCFDKKTLRRKLTALFPKIPLGCLSLSKEETTYLACLKIKDAGELKRLKEFLVPFSGKSLFSSFCAETDPGVSKKG